MNTINPLAGAALRSTSNWVALLQWSLIVVALVTTFWSVSAQAEDSAASHAEHKDHKKHSYVGSHGMALMALPDGRFVAHHMPLYRAPHDYQMLYEVTFDQAKPVQQLLQQHMTLPDSDRNAKVVSLLPEVFDLRKMIAGEAFSIPAKIFAGHFERGGKVVQEVTAHFKAPVYSRHISMVKKGADAVVSKTQPFANVPFVEVPLAQGKVLAVHTINTQPSFDAVLLVNQSNNDWQNDCHLAEQASVTALEAALAKCQQGELLYFEWRDFQ